MWAWLQEGIRTETQTIAEIMKRVGERIWCWIDWRAQWCSPYFPRQSTLPISLKNGKKWDLRVRMPIAQCSWSFNHLGSPEAHLYENKSKSIEMVLLILKPWVFPISGLVLALFSPKYSRSQNFSLCLGEYLVFNHSLILASSAINTVISWVPFPYGLVLAQCL